jgi:hypothetical protein
MVKIVNGDIEVMCERGLSFGPVRRRVLLSVGASVMLLAVLLPLLGPLRFGLSWPLEVERWVPSGLLVLFAGVLALKAGRPISAQLYKVTVRATGVLFEWDEYVLPNGAAVRKQAFVAWSDMEKVQWTEEGLEHEFKQYLSLSLKNTLINGVLDHKFLICDTRSYRECMALSSNLPRTTDKPAGIVDLLRLS